MGKKSKTKPVKDSKREANEQIGPTSKKTSHATGHEVAEEAELRQIRIETQQRRRKLSKDMSENPFKSILEQWTRIPASPLPTPDQSSMAIALAVQYDEASNDEAVLKTPLESGLLYNPKRFAAAWQHLQSVSVPLSKSTPTSKLSTFSGRHIEKHASPSLNTLSIDPQLDTRQALTPIILSGLVSQLSKDDSSHTSITFTELVQFTQGMRRDALSRVQMRQLTERVLQTVNPILLIVSAMILGHYALQQFQTTLDEYGFGTECDLMPPPYRQACRTADASTWKTLGLDVESCTVEDCSSISGDNKLVPLYAQHTLLEPTEWSVIPLDQIVGRTGNVKPRKKRRKSATQQQHSSHSQDFDDAVESPIRWLGDSVTNSLVREALVDARGKNEYSAPFALLDVGSGLSSLLYSLLTPDFPFRQWTYHGISISRPEIRHSRQLLHRHQILQASRSGDLPLKNITLQQSNYDDALPVKSYDAIVAVESLSFNPNLTKTITSLAASLKSKGKLVVINDVAMPWFQGSETESSANRTARMSIVTHEAWLEAFAAAGLVFQQPPRDLNLEYERSTAVESFSRSHKLLQGIWGKIADWYGRNGGGIGTEGTIARGMRLVSDLVQQSEGTELRLSAHSRANLTLMMYVCTKK